MYVDPRHKPTEYGTYILLMLFFRRGNVKESVESKRKKDWRRDKADLRGIEKDDKRTSSSAKSDREVGVGEGMFRKPMDDQR